MVGVMSLMPALMGVPIAEILESLDMASDVHDALEHGAGALGALLVFAERLQDGDIDGCHALLLARLPCLDEQSVNASAAHALAWAGIGVRFEHTEISSEV